MPRICSLSRSSVPRASLWSFVPLAVLVAAAIAANIGVSMTRPAFAASASINVSADVSATSSTISNDCVGDLLPITFSMASLSAGTCTITFGATNAAGITLSAEDQTQGDQFFIQGGGNFADAAGSCSAMSGDEIGYKVRSGSSATVNLCGGATAAGNLGYSPIPNDAPAPSPADTVCTTSALGTQTCIIDVGMRETGGDAPSGTYSGTIALATS